MDEVDPSDSKTMQKKKWHIETWPLVEETIKEERHKISVEERNLAYSLLLSQTEIEQEAHNRVQSCQSINP